MPMRNKKLVVVLAACLIAAATGRRGFWFGYYQVQGRLSPVTFVHGDEPPTAEQFNLMADVREVGIQRDRSKSAMVRVALQERHRSVQIVALLAAGRLGDAEALPRIDAIARERFGEHISDLADIIRARIKTEQTVGRATQSGTLARKLDHFLSTARLSRARMEEGARAYRDHGRTKGHFPTYNVYALRQTSEFVEESGRAGVPAAAERLGIDFSLDRSAELRVRLAPMPKSQRIKWLIESIARKQVMTGEDYYEVRALADEGEEAVEPIVTKLHSVRNNRQGYSYPGIKSLFRALVPIGDPRAIPAVSIYLDDPDEWLRHYSMQALDALERGIRSSYAIDY